MPFAVRVQRTNQDVVGVQSARQMTHQRTEKSVARFAGHTFRDLKNEMFEMSGPFQSRDSWPSASGWHLKGLR